MSSRSRQELFALTTMSDVGPGDILLEPCDDGECDGPWHESGVESVTRDDTHTYATTLVDSGCTEIWLRRHEDPVHVLYPRRRLDRRAWWSGK